MARDMPARALAATGKTERAWSLAKQVEDMQEVISSVEPMGEWRARPCCRKR